MPVRPVRRRQRSRPLGTPICSIKNAISQQIRYSCSTGPRRSLEVRSATTVGSALVTSPDVAISVPSLWGENAGYTRFGRVLQDVVVTLAPEDLQVEFANIGAHIYGLYPGTPMDYAWLPPGHPPWSAWLGGGYCGEEYGQGALITTGFEYSSVKSSDFCATVWGA